MKGLRGHAGLQGMPGPSVSDSTASYAHKICRHTAAFADIYLHTEKVLLITYALSLPSGTRR